MGTVGILPRRKKGREATKLFLVVSYHTLVYQYKYWTCINIFIRLFFQYLRAKARVANRINTLRYVMAILSEFLVEDLQFNATVASYTSRVVDWFIARVSKTSTCQIDAL